MKRILIYLISIMLFSYKANSQISYNVNFNASDLTINNNTEIDGNTYCRVNMQKVYFLKDTGNPSLPVKYIKLFIPEGKDVNNISFTIGSSITYNLTAKIFPVQKPKSISIPDNSFTEPNINTYNSTNAFPLEMVKVIHNGLFDGKNRIITLQIIPFQYYPLSNTLTFYSSININVNLKQSTENPIISVKNRSQYAVNLFSDILKNLVNNPNDIPSTTNTSLQSLSPTSFIVKPRDYFIITDTNLVSYFTNFINWKRRKGIDIGIISKQYIYSHYITAGGDILHSNHISDTSGCIRQFLYDAWQNGTVWALLAGDMSNMAVRKGVGYPGTTNPAWVPETDMYFQDFISDWNADGNGLLGEPTDNTYWQYPNIFVGRLLCSTDTDILSWTSNVLKYEQNPGYNGDYGYLTKSFMIQADGMQNYMAPAGSNGDAGWVGTYLPPSFINNIWGETPSPYASYNTNGYVIPGGIIMGTHKGEEVITEMNNHYGLYGWFCHGGTGKDGSGGESGIAVMTNGDNGYPIDWKLQAEDAHDYSGSQSQANNGLDNLSNSNYPSLLWSISCYVMPYGMTKAIGLNGARNCGEAFTTLTNSGGAAFLGNTRDGYYMGLTDQMFCNFLNLIQQPLAMFHIGIAEELSKLTFDDIHNNPYPRFCDYSHNLVGCPETEIWTAYPSKFQVSCDPPFVIVNTSNNITVMVNNITNGTFALVCLYKDGQIFERQSAQAIINNQAIVTFNDILASSAGDILVTVTSHNYIPFQTNIPVISNCNYNNTPTYISANTTWSDVKELNNDIIINANVTLNITNNVFVNKSAKICVMPRAKLIIDGGKLSSACSGLWKGIEVWGNTNQNQLPVNGVYQQGIIQIINGGTIENAECGIVTSAFDGSGNEIAGKHGGIIFADNAIFKNNRVAVDFREYHNMVNGSESANISYFNLCNFTRDNALADGANFNTFVDLKTVYGISFKGCSFADTYATQNSQQGNGIVALDSYFLVGNGCNCGNVLPCPTNCVIRSTFNNLFYGVWAKKAVTNRLFSVVNSDFTKNRWSIVDQGVNSFTLTGNNINFQTINGAPDYAGVYLQNCTGFTIEENNFNSPSGVNPIGVYVYNTGGANDVIYKNTFTNNAICCLTAGSCRNMLGSTGLQFKCNLFTGSVLYDICVTGTGMEGVRNSQGDLSMPAGNQFSTIVGNAPIYNISNQSSNMIRYYYGSGANQNPTRISSNVTKTLVSYANACTSHIGGGMMSLSSAQIQTLVQDYSTAKTIQTASQLQFKSLLDGGNTTAMINQIETSWPNDTWELYTKLLNKSPYLSEEVLKEASENTNVLPNIITFNILKSNPDALKNTDFIDYLNGKPVPLSAWMIDTLNSVRKQLTVRTNLENYIEYYSSLKDEAGFRLIQDIQSDSNGVNHAQMQIWSENIESFYTEIMRVNDKMEVGDYFHAEEILNAIPQKCELKEALMDEYKSFGDLFDLLLSFHENGKTIYNLDSGEVVKVLEIADIGVGCAKTYACNICSYYGYICSDEMVIPKLDLNNKSILHNPTITTLLNEKQEFVEAYPIPTKDWVSFKWKLLSNDNKTTVEVTNSLGVSLVIIALETLEGEKIIDTREWNAGAYYYKAKQDGKTIQTGKIVISR